MAASDPDADTHKSQQAAPAASGPQPIKGPLAFLDATAAHRSQPGAPAQMGPPEPPPPTTKPEPPPSDAESTKPPQAIGEQAYDEIKRRHQMGAGAAAVGVVAIVGALIWSAVHVGTPLHALLVVGEAAAPVVERAVLFGIVANAIITVALVFFGYSMLRLAERMFLPRHLLHDERAVGMVRALLGVSTPAKAAMDGVKQTAEDIATIAKPFAELAKPIVEAVKGASGGDKK